MPALSTDVAHHPKKSAALPIAVADFATLATPPELPTLIGEAFKFLRTNA